MYTLATWLNMAQDHPPSPNRDSEVSRWRLLCNSPGNGTRDAQHSHKTWDKAMPMGEISGPQSRAMVGVAGVNLTIGKKQEIQKRYRAALKNKGFFSEIALTPILYKYTNVDREKIYIYI